MARTAATKTAPAAGPEASGPLDERALRTPGFREDVGIRLADGQVWYFPEATIRFAPAAPPRNRVRVSSLGPEHLALVEAATEAKTADELIDAELALAAFVLRCNYGLDYDQLGELIQFDYREGADQELREAVLEVCLGLGPKPSAAGEK